MGSSTPSGGRVGRPPGRLSPHDQGSKQGHERTWNGLDAPGKHLTSKLVMEGNATAEASDVEVPGPGTPAADLSAMDRRTSEDDNGNASGHETVHILELPLSGDIKCSFCARIGRSRCFAKEAEFGAHCEKEHLGKRVIWKCAPCRRVFEKLQGWRCHFGKCKGPRSNEVQNEAQIRCETCGSTFRTPRGLSQHERHRHPAERNRKREQGANGSGNQPGRRAYAWTEEETALLAELNERYKHLRQPNVAIREFLPGKSLKQISDKRRQITAQIRAVAEAEISSIEEPLAEPAEEEERVEPQIEAEEPLMEEEEPTEPRTGEEDDWKEPIRRAIRESGLEEDHPLRGIEALVEGLAEQETTDESQVDAVLRVMIQKLLQTAGDKTGTDRAKRGRTAERGRQESHRTRRRKYEYARIQELYKKCPRKLLDLAIAGRPVGEDKKIEAPSKEEVEPLYRRLWGLEGPHIREELYRPAQESVNMRDIWYPITVNETVQRMKKIKKDTAAGIDGIRKEHLRMNGALQVLVKIYNLMMMHRVYPAQWRQHRTTLIPKPGKSAEKASDWRPITIGSLLSRIHSAMIDKRIREKVKQHRRQKGFTSEDGCKNNIAILSSALVKMKEEEGGIITILDISKAFDTVPHQAVKRCLTRKGVPREVADYIRKMYDSCRTTIFCRKQEKVEIMLRRGVKQGDPLSPLIFNLILEPIIEKVDRMTEGISLGGEKVSILAFADDLLLLAKDRKEATRQSGMIVGFLKELGMHLSIEKSSTVQIVSKGRTWHQADPKLYIANERVPYTDPEQVVAYLGATIGPWKGLAKVSNEEIIEAVKSVGRMGLKPHQKINMIRTYLLPRFIHKMVASTPSLGSLRQLDQEVKQQVKQILHLHQTTTDGVIYTSKSHGGLGIQRVENIVILAKLRSAIKMARSEDGAVRQTLAGQEAKIERYASSIGLSWPVEMKDVERARIILKKKETDRWKGLASQGQGIKEFAGDRIGNEWLYKPELLKPSRYLDALKLRTNTFGSRVVLYRAKKDIDVNCRRCGVQAETLGHILGNCTHTKPMRIHRHDEIVKLVENNVPEGCEVFVEPSVSIGGELRKPDLVIKDHGRVFVVDVSVRYEDKENLRNAYREKKRKYKDTAEYFKRSMNATRAEVIPIIVGCRGAMPMETVQNMKKLGIGRKHCLTASLIALRSSIEMANQFLDYDHTR